MTCEENEGNRGLNDNNKKAYKDQLTAIFLVLDWSSLPFSLSLILLDT